MVLHNSGAMIYYKQFEAKLENQGRQINIVIVILKLNIVWYYPDRFLNIYNVLVLYFWDNLISGYQKGTFKISLYLNIKA